MEKEFSSWPSDCAWPAPISTKDKNIHNPQDPESFKPEQLEHDGQYMLKVLSYFNDLVYEGLLNEDYAITSSKHWKPEIGGEWWECDYFDFEAWQRSFSILVNTLKLPQPNPVRSIEAVTGYTFVNENLLRQAFTRHAFAVEYNNNAFNVLEDPNKTGKSEKTDKTNEVGKTNEAGKDGETCEADKAEVADSDGRWRKELGDNEQLEFIGDIVLNTIVTQEIIRKLTEVHKYNCFAPFQSIALLDSVDPEAPKEPDDVIILPQMSLYGSSVRQTMQTIQKGQLKRLGKGIELEARKLGEGEFTKIRAKFVSKEYLSAQASALGLDKFILYGSGEEVSDSAKEDVIEALIGAVAVDSGWNWTVLNTVVDRLINFNIEKIDLEKNYYDKFNEWHQKRWGCMPTYMLTGIKPSGFKCELKYFTAFYAKEDDSNDKDENDDSYDSYNMCSSSNSSNNIYSGRGNKGSKAKNPSKQENTISSFGETKCKAREVTAEAAYKFISDSGLLQNNVKRDSGITPSLENAVNQIQELKQKRYITDITYSYLIVDEEGNTIPIENVANTGNAASICNTGTHFSISSRSGSYGRNGSDSNIYGKEHSIKERNGKVGEIRKNENNEKAGRTEVSCWLCYCQCEQPSILDSVFGQGRDKNKRMAKKKAALDVLKKLFK